MFKYVCPYEIGTVVVEFECPKSADTVAMSTPALIKMEAWACPNHTKTHQ